MTTFDANAMMAAAETKTSQELTELMAEIEILAGTAIQTVGDIVTAINSKKKATDREKLTEAHRAKEKLTRVVASLKNGTPAPSERGSRQSSQRQSEPAPVVVSEPTPVEAPAPVTPVVAPVPEPTLIKKLGGSIRKNFGDNRSKNTTHEAPASS